MSFTEGYSQTNPMFGDINNDTVHVEGNKYTSASNKIEPNNVASHKKSFFNSFIKKNAQIQKSIKDRLFNLANSYKNSGDKSLILIIFLLAFLYGILHSLGPGHGKVFVFSYILTEKPKILRAIVTSYYIAFLHGLSGLVVALIIVFSLKTYTSEALKIENASNIIAQISYAIIFIIGALLLIKSLFHQHYKENVEKKKIVPFVISVGLVPCPGTIITVTFLASSGLLSVGIFSAFFIILGMGITISLIGIISLFSTEIIKRLFRVNSKRYEKFYTIISSIGALFMLLFGLLFFMGSL
ncbi:MAG: hypothetical protein JEZ09_13345 [Salinivirgaceae bacterium]|nr:hypothetical protein [Salinivirgaceae bacterium]